MAFDGAGAFSRLYNWVTDKANGVKIRADRMDAEFDGIATALSSCILRDGRSTITADMPWGGRKITGLGDGAAAADAVNLGQADARYLAATSYLSAAQVYLTVSGGNLVLVPFGGLQIVIGGTTRSIPVAGVSLAATSLTPGTVYNIYAYWTGSAVALEAAVTAHSTDSATGLEIKTGDASRTLVGKAVPSAGPIFADSSSAINVISWFNRRLKTASNKLAATVTVTATTAAEVSTNLRVSFLSWGQDTATTYLSGSWTVTGAAVGFASINYDGATSGQALSATSSTASDALGLSDAAVLSEGSHYATIFGYRTGGTNVLFSGVAATGICATTVTVLG